MKLIWTKEKCKEEALKYESRVEFQRLNRTAYNKAWKNGWLDDICSHMSILGNLTNRAIYCFEFEDNSVYIGLTYNIQKRKNEHLTNPRSAVFLHITNTGIIPIFKQLTEYINIEDAVKMEGMKIKEYIDNNWNILNRKVHGDVGSNILKWTYDNCKEEALKYNDKTSFMRSSSGAYKSALINGWLNDITPHMDVKIKINYWTKEKCQEEALKYDTKNKFKVNSGAAYAFAYRNGFIDEICKHMKKFHTGFRGRKLESYSNFEIN